MVQEEGEWPSVRVFGQSPEAMLHVMAQHDGKDVLCIPFYGVPIQFSRAPRRIAFLPDGTARPLVRPNRTIVVDVDHVPLQEDWFMGPPELSVSSYTPTPPTRPPDPPPEDVGGGDDTSGLDGPGSLDPVT